MRSARRRAPTSPALRGLSMCSRPPSAATRSSSPSSPEPAPMSAPPTPSSLTAISRRSPSARTSTLACDALGVLGDVGQRLGDHVVGGDLDRLRRALGEVDGQLDRERRALQQRLDRRLEPVVGEHRGVQPARELAQLGQRRAELLARALDRGVRGRRVLVDQAVGDPQADRERDEPLLRAVVEVALEPPPLAVAGGDHARPRRGELLARLGVGERLGDELGERGDAVLGPGREGVGADARHDDRAPQLAVEDDRRADPGGDAELLQALGEAAGQAAVVVDALGLAAAADLRRERLTVELDPRAERHARHVRLVPLADHVGGAVVAVADHVRRRGREQPAHLLGHDREHAGGLAGRRDERRHAPQRRLLVEQRLDDRIVRRGLHRSANPPTRAEVWRPVVSRRTSRALPGMKTNSSPSGRLPSQPPCCWRAPRMPLPSRRRPRARRRRWTRRARWSAATPTRTARSASAAAAFLRTAVLVCRADDHAGHPRARDLRRIAPDVLAVAVEHAHQVPRALDVAEQVAAVPVLRDEPQRLALAAAADEDRDVAAHRLAGC